MKYITFSFDDGYLNSCKKACEILHPYKATFYLTSGWIRPNQCEIIDELNKNIDHGSIEDWTNIYKEGHDIGAHTHTHILMTDPTIHTECSKSLEFIKQIQAEPPYSFATTFFGNVSHAIINMFDSIRVGYKQNNFYNSLEKIDLKLMRSFCPLAEKRTMDSVRKIIQDMPDGHWIILTLHGLDGEGFSPVSLIELKNIKEYALSCGFLIKTVKEVTTEIIAKRKI